MGLCAGFAVADFKPICWGKIGLVYHPSFIVHIVFVNPSNYISPCCCHSFLPLFFFFLPTQANRSRQKQKALLQWESNTAVNTGTATVGHKMPSAVSRQTKEPLFPRKATATREDHMLGKKETIMLLHGMTELCSVSLSGSHTNRLWSVAQQFRSRGVGGCKQAENYQARKYGKSVWLPFQRMEPLQNE